MGIATKIPQDAFSGLQLDAGVLLNTFDPTDPAIADGAIICATTGGINPQCVPTYSDFGEDVDNVPLNMKEFKHLDGWECKISTTSLGTTPELIKMALGAADIDGSNSSKIVPRRNVNQSDFGDLWWVGDRADGGLVAIRLMNALSTGGFSLQTTKNGKGQISIEITGHVSINAQDVVPMEFYSIDPSENPTPSIELNAHSITLAVGDTFTLIAKTIPNAETVTWTSSANAKASVSGGVVTAEQAGTTIITAAITVDSVTYNDTCTVIVEAAGG